MGWNALIEDTHDLFAEARTEGVDNEKEAREWVSEWIEGLDGDQVKDVAHFFAVPSFEIIHPARLKAELVKRMVQEMLNF